MPKSSSCVTGWPNYGSMNSESKRTRSMTCLMSGPLRF
ncbi:hypothetical protein LINPERHAP1_LOCUS26059 [Linum perenne]